MLWAGCVPFLGSPECVGAAADNTPVLRLFTFLTFFLVLASPVFFILHLLVPASQLLPSTFSLSVFVFFPGKFVHLSAAISAGPRVELAFSLLSLLISTSSLFSKRDCCRCSLNNTLFSFQGSVSSCCERVDARRCVSASSALGFVEWGRAPLFLDMFLTLSPYLAHLSLLEGACVLIQRLWGFCDINRLLFSLFFNLEKSF